MAKILIVYHSHSGNTEKMAEAIVEGARTIQDIEVEAKRYGSPWMLGDSDAILVGAPTYHHNMTHNTREFLEQVAFHSINLKDKVGAAFGSYGWSGEAPRLVLEIMKNKFEMQVIEPPLLIKYTPDQAGLEKCREFGKKIAKNLSS
ncbi:MAG: FprA family A-type flavoprotein [Candidatus Bathyarchaeota archaeon]|nr:MAG: FprA family A-type flavoprotein [Candidatus Bathyarchaeota archaeon]